MALGLGGHAIAAGDFADLDSAIVVGVVGDELVYELAEDCLDFAIALACDALRFGFGVERSGFGVWGSTYSVETGVSGVRSGSFRRGFFGDPHDLGRRRSDSDGWSGVFGSSGIAMREDGESGLFEQGAVFGAEVEVLEAFSDDGLRGIDGGGVRIGRSFWAAAALLSRFPFQGFGAKRVASWVSVTGSSEA